MVVNNEFEGMWKEAVMVCFKVLSWDLPGGTEKNYEKSQDSQSPE